MPEPDKQTSDPGSAWSSVGQHAGYGLTMAGSLGLFMYMGWLADSWLGSMPLLTIFGAFLGGGAGIYYVIRSVLADAGPETGTPGEDE